MLGQCDVCDRINYADSAILRKILQIDVSHVKLFAPGQLSRPVSIRSGDRNCIPERKYQSRPFYY